MHCTLFSFGKKRHSTEVNFRSHTWGTQDNVATTNVLRNNVLPKVFWERKAFRWFKVETLLWQLACSDCSLPTCLTNTRKNFWEQLCGGTALGGCVTSTRICNQTQSNPEQWQSWLQMFFFFFPKQTSRFPAFGRAPFPTQTWECRMVFMCVLSGCGLTS